MPSEGLTRSLSGLSIWRRPKCPFANLLELTAGPMGPRADGGEMEECVWVQRPEVVAFGLSGVGWRQSPEAHQVRCTQRRQRSFEGGQGNIAFQAVR